MSMDNALYKYLNYHIQKENQINNFIMIKYYNY